ncbi:hypothetical protein B0T10DRAFT_561941 [Thelonectria olida]|uniref:Uncharacterized protein n=1 Tax=Thelonectria olida TaxID=1576542 RepID=A0A9P9APB9_9HYPO|nr:hypothetical protein B0T10DRAFT_561941 [Thelonectria olida]
MANGWVTVLMEPRFDNSVAGVLARSKPRRMKTGSAPKQSKTFDKGTPDKHTFKITQDSSVSLGPTRRYATFARIIHGCNSDKRKNPMNWKYGDTYTRNEDTFEVTPKHDRPPLIKETYGKCKGKYELIFGHYTTHGKQSFHPLRFRPLEI